MKADENLRNLEWQLRNAIADLSREVERVLEASPEEEAELGLGLLRTKTKRLKLRFENYAAARHAETGDDGGFVTNPLSEPTSSGSPFSDERVLLVEDNAFTRDVIKANLQQWGLKVCLATSAEDAIRILDTEPLFDLGIFDISLPGKSGEALAKHCRACPDLEKMRLVSLSGVNYGPPSAQFDRALAKPITMDDLRRELVQVLELEAPGPIVSVESFN